MNVSRIDSSDPLAVVELMELTSAELERRAQALLKLSRDLLAQAAHHATLAELPAQRSVGRFGAVTEAEAVKAAIALDQFTVQGFAETLGVGRTAALRWLSKLMTREHPIIERRDDGSYAYLDPRPAVSELRSARAPRTRRQHARKVGARMGPGGLPGTGSGLLRGVPKESQPTVREAISAGWRLSERGDGHLALTRDKRSISIPKTPRNAGNAADQLRQALSRSSSSDHTNNHA